MYLYVNSIVLVMDSTMWGGIAHINLQQGISQQGVGKQRTDKVDRVWTTLAARPPAQSRLSLCALQPN